jgi:PAS domain S-box-containing protein
MATSTRPQLSFSGEQDRSFEHLIAGLSTRLITLDADHLNGEIESAQQSVCEAFGFDRSTLTLWDEDAKTFIVSYSWARPGFESAKEIGDRDLTWFAGQVLSGEGVCFARVSELPPEAAQDVKVLGRLLGKSNITIPLRSGIRVLGSLAFSTLRYEREWPDLLVDRLHLVAELFSNAVMRTRSAKQLLESQQQMALAVESAELGFWTWNPRREEIWASERTLNLFGRSRDTGLSYEDFINAVHPDDRANVQDSIAAAALLPMEFRLEHRISRPDGSVRWVSTRGRSDADESGKSVRLSGVVIDISERKLADERFRLAVESSPTAMVMVNSSGIIVMANAQVERIFGYRREELVGKSVDMLIPRRFLDGHPSHRAEFAGRPVARPMGAGRELFGLRKDGSEFRVDIGLNPIRTDEGSFVLTSVTDVTDRVEALEAVRRSEKLFRTVANSAPVLIWMSGTDKLVTFLNAGWLAFTGRKLEDELGEGWAAGVHPDDLQQCLKTYSRAFDARVDFEMEYRLRRHDGQYRWIVDHGAPMLESDGTFRGYVGSCLDITDRRQSEQELIDANKSLLEANQRIGTLKEQLEQENVYLKKEIVVERNHFEVIGRSEPIRRVLVKVEQVAPTVSTVLLLGETGTGKELIARAIHRNSKRKDRLMVKVNCAALPASLVESELFGREKGAFTGALTREIGRFELAHDSTIFLDEIGELPLELQAKLLRVLQEGEFERLGSSRTIHVDARLIAATSRDLEAAVRAGKFREDLYYRLNVFPIHIPPLRERREDIPILTWHFLRELGNRMGREIESVRAGTMTSFQGYSWPGNVRELRNVIERHLITNPGPTFEAELPEAIRVGAHDGGGTLEEVEKNHILRVLELTSWRVRGHDGAAEILNLKATTLESRMKKLGIARKLPL